MHLPPVDAEEGRRQTVVREMKLFLLACCSTHLGLAQTDAAPCSGDNTRWAADAASSWGTAGWGRSFWRSSACPHYTGRPGSDRRSRRQPPGLRGQSGRWSCNLYNNNNNNDSEKHYKTISIRQRFIKRIISFLFLFFFYFSFFLGVCQENFHMSKRVSKRSICIDRLRCVLNIPSRWGRQQEYSLS